MNKSAADTLDAIREGGLAMVLNAHARLGECRVALEEGDFGSAMHAAMQLQDRLAHLAHAQQHLGALRKATAVKVENLEVGMVADGGMEIVSVEPCECGQTNCHKRVVAFDNGVVQAMLPGWELLVVNG